MSENKVKDMANVVTTHTLQPLDVCFDATAKDIIQNLYVLPSSTNLSSKELINNALIPSHLSPVTYTYTQVLTEIFTQELTKYGSEQCPQRYHFDKLFVVFAVRINKAERMFSVSRRINSWLWNQLNDATFKILLKLVSSFDIELVEETINSMPENIIKNLSSKRFLESNSITYKRMINQPRSLLNYILLVLFEIKMNPHDFLRKRTALSETLSNEYLLENII